MTSIEAIVNRQILKWELENRETGPGRTFGVRHSPIVTISRQSGSRGSYFGSRLSQGLGYQRLQRKAVDLVCGNSVYRNRVLEILDRTVRDELQSQVTDRIGGRTFDDGGRAEHRCRVIMSMAELGSVVVMGCGGSQIVGPQNGFRMRVVCPREKRIENLIKYKGLIADEAVARIDESDRKRQEFIAEHFGSDIDAPQDYDLIVNSALIDVEEMVGIAMAAIEAKRSKLTYLNHDQF